MLEPGRNPDILCLRGRQNGNSDHEHSLIFSSSIAAVAGGLFRWRSKTAGRSAAICSAGFGARHVTDGRAVGGARNVTSAGILHICAGTTDGDLPGIKVSVNELKRTSGTLTLKLTIINGLSTEFSPQGVFDGDDFHRFRHLGGVHLIDGASKKKYFVVTDSNGSYLSSNQISNIAPQSQITVWAKFPAPPDDVQKITVEIPHFIPMEDIPISR